MASWPGGCTPGATVCVCEASDRFLKCHCMHCRPMQALPCAYRPPCICMSLLHVVSAMRCAGHSRAHAHSNICAGMPGAPYTLAQGMPDTSRWAQAAVLLQSIPRHQGSHHGAGLPGDWAAHVALLRRWISTCPASLQESASNLPGGRQCCWSDSWSWWPSGFVKAAYWHRNRQDLGRQGTQQEAEPA